MEVLVNDLSIAGQFADVIEFREAVSRLMEMRTVVTRFGRVLRCHRRIVESRVTHDCSLSQAIQGFTIDQRRDFMRWITTTGPFWDDDQAHDPDDWFQHKDMIVTSHAIGEAAYACFQGSLTALVSFTPSGWEYSPLRTEWYKSADTVDSIDVSNFWAAHELDAALAMQPSTIGSWEEMETACRARFANLRFGNEAFRPLAGQPFRPGVSDRILARLEVLHRLTVCFDEDGKLTKVGHELIEQYFSGDKAWFSDSSETEVREFAKDLTFRHPDRPDEQLFCPWHGKVKTPQYRIHHSWPVRAREPLYVLHIGPKITKR